MGEGEDGETPGHSPHYEILPIELRAQCVNRLPHCIVPQCAMREYADVCV